MFLELIMQVRREKISERMKFLQDLVPGCSKVNIFIVDYNLTAVISIKGYTYIVHSLIRSLEKL